ncbi:MAG TPA: hypothetical protein PLV92_16785, partial [Pirellulaceae bacterium]|nr:hypothetical protein [Pirellulaceae bacterium]
MQFQFALPGALAIAGPLAALLAWATWRQRHHFRSRGQAILLTLLRAAALVVIVPLVARPVYVESEEELRERKQVVVLVDRSESMALEERGKSRYRSALEFAREDLLPALRSAGLSASAVTFAEDATTVSGDQLAKAVPDGRRTNLARAVIRGLTNNERPPLALIALTDGAANDDTDSRRAISALVDARVPLIGVGFGSESGPRTLAVRYVEAPPVAPPKQQFRVTASLEGGGAGEMPALDLLLLRDGQFVEKKTIPAGPAGRIWQDGFDVTEAEEGVYRYTVQLAAPPDAGVRLLNAADSAAVRVVGEKQIRVLFVQGALTWDYKFIRLALASDPGISMTGLSRTSTESFFYQNVENAAELKGGFPTKLEDLAPFSVVVLSSIRHSDLKPEQQEVLSRFCGEFGGGVLMIGGPETFDGSWRESKLEQLLAVRFAPLGTSLPDRPFQLRLTADALSESVLKISDMVDVASAWSRVPPFSNYAIVDEVKPGAQVWVEHPQDRGPAGPRALMAVQRFGAGRSAVIGVQNFWRWRLAKDSDPRQFDRFWQQLLRFLAEGGREQLAIRIPDQTLVPPTDVRFVLERQPDPKNPQGGVQ